MNTPTITTTDPLIDETTFHAHIFGVQLRPLKPVGVPQAQLDSGLDYDQPVVLLPVLMSLHEQGFDLGSILAGA